MPQYSSFEIQLGRQLRQLSYDYRNRWSEKAGGALSKILFHHLANRESDNLHYFFPNGPPLDDTKPWLLSEAQGATDGAEYSEAARGRRCGHIFRNGEATYSCRTCTTDDTCVLCTKCFEASDHEGHQVYVSMSPGANGCCDCGDPEAWVRPVTCSIHTESPDDRSLPNGARHQLSTLPPRLQQSIKATISQVFDFLCDVLSCCPEDMREPKTEDPILQDEESSRLRQLPYGVADEQDNEFALVLWNDEKHTVDEVAEQVRKACRKLMSFGELKALEVDHVGRSVLVYSNDLKDILKQARILSQINVTVTIRSARDTFREQMCDTIVDWLSDIAGGSVGDDHHILMDTICQEMLRPWRIGSGAFNLAIAKHGIVDQQRSDNEDYRFGPGRAFFAQQALLRAIPGALAAGLQQTDGVPVPDVPNVMDDDGQDQMDEVEVEDEDEMEIDDVFELVVDEIDAELDTGILGWAPVRETAPNSRPRHRDPTPDESEDDASTRPPIDTSRLFTSIPQTPGQKPVGNAVAPAYWHERNTLEGKLYQDLPPQEDLNQPIRMDHLILYDLRMWKKMRNNLKHLYISTVVTIPEFKRVLSLRFAVLYTHLAQLYLVADREPDHSVINLSLQMLTTPSITAEVVEKGNFYTRLLAILYTFLTKRQVGNPKDVDPSAAISFEPGVTSNRRIYHFFSDMRYLLDASYVQERIRSENDYLFQFLDFAKLFQGICPNIRAVGEHIEYESDAWINASIIVRDVTRLSRQFCEAFKWSRDQDPASICRAIRQTAKVTVINSLGTEHERFTQSELKAETTFKTIPEFYFEASHTARLGRAAKLHTIVSFDVEVASMSFHHALHYTLSWLIDCGKSMSKEQLKTLLNFSPQALQSQESRSSGKPKIPSLGAEQYLLALFDIPLRVCAWLAQMRAGMWVRNGITLRHQMGTFRGVGQREVSYQRDIFMLQVALVVCEPATFLVSAIDRFGLLNWIGGRYPIKDGYEDHQMVDVAEEFAHLLIVLLSDRTLLFPIEEDPNPFASIAKRDIIQVLCFKPLTFSELTARLSDRVQEMVNFQEILHEVATYRPPEGISDSGMLQLREEYLKDIDPYHVYYSKSQREEAENLLRKHAAKQTSRPIDEVFYEPILRPIRSGIFTSLSDFSQLPLFGQIIFCLLRYVTWADVITPNVSSGRIEGLLQTTLHLILIAVNEDRKEQTSSSRPSFVDTVLFSKMPSDSTTEAGEVPFTILHMLFTLIKRNKVQASKPRLRFTLTHIYKRKPEAFNNVLLASGMSKEWAPLMVPPGSEMVDATAQKKKQALDRQARVLASFKKQQNDFVENQTIDWGFDDMDESGDGAETMGQDSKSKAWAYPVGTCIFCQEEANEQHLYGTLGYLNQSKIFRQTDLGDADFIKEVCTVPYHLDRSADDIRPFGVASNNAQRVQKLDSEGKVVVVERRGLGRGFPSPYLKKGPVITGCGHVMHFSCFQTYDEATMRRHSFQIARQHPEDIALKEFVCPLCKAIGNIFLPVAWKPQPQVELSAMKTSSFKEWLPQHVRDSVSVQGWPCPSTLEESYRHYAIDTFIPSIASAFAITHRGSREAIAQGPPTASRFRLPAILRFNTAASGETYPDSSNDMTSTRPAIMTELIKAYERLQNVMLITERQAGSVTGDLGGVQRSADVLARALGLSLSAVEIAQRGVEAYSVTFVEGIPDQVVSHLRILSETASSFTAITGHDGPASDAQAYNYSRSQAYRLLGSDDNHTLRSRSDDPLLAKDIFVFAAECSVFMAPTLHVDIHHIIHLCYFAEIVKVVVALLHEPDLPWTLANGEFKNGNFSATSLQSSPQQDQNASALIEYVLEQCKRNALHGGAQCSDRWNDSNPNDRCFFDRLVYQMIAKYALPFLRKCALLLHVRYGVDYSSSAADAALPEVSRLAKHLGLPNIDEMIEDFLSATPQAAALQRISATWIMQWSIENPRGLTLDQRRRRAIWQLRLPHPTIFELIALPDTHDTLNSEAMSRRCPTTGRELDDPSICLFCGTFVCTQSQCCAAHDQPRLGSSVGGCFQHREKCGGEVGMFLNIRKCAVIMLHRGNGSFFPAPYLDRHGEVDMGLRRKNQLFLSQRRYDRLFRDLWLGNGVPSAVARKLEAEVNNGGWETI